MKRIYLDYAAATPLDSQVIKSMEPYLTANFYNPSAMYLAARKVRADLEAARGKVASILGCRPAEIIFTSGATEANNLVIKGVRGAFSDGGIVVSVIEHESVLAPAVNAGAKLAPVGRDGLVNLKALEKQVTASTVLVSIGLVNNEIGVLQPLREVSALIKAERTRRLKAGIKLPIYLHSDAAQAANFFDLHVSRLGVDLMSVNGAKIYGPKQTGVLFMRAGTMLQPQILGGGQEMGIRSGTENVAGAIGFAKALELSQAGRKQESERTGKILLQLETGLTGAAKNVVVNGSSRHRAPHILNVSFPGCDNERLMMELDEKGVLVATGSACSASKDEPSHVLRAIGLSVQSARSAIRFSVGRQTTQSDISKTLKILTEILRR